MIKARPHQQTPAPALCLHCLERFNNRRRLRAHVLGKPDCAIKHLAFLKITTAAAVEYEDLLFRRELERVVAENQGGAFVSPSASPWGPKWKIDP